MVAILGLNYRVTILPKTKEGEAAFAASDTNIAIVGDKTWVATRREGQSYIVFAR